MTETKENIFGAFLVLRDQKNEKNQFYSKKQVITGNMYFLHIKYCLQLPDRGFLSSKLTETNE